MRRGEWQRGSRAQGNIYRASCDRHSRTLMQVMARAEDGFSIEIQNTRTSFVTSSSARASTSFAAALAFFRRALCTVAPRVPRKITLDGHVPSRRALWLLRREHQFMLSRTYRRLGKWSLKKEWAIALA